MHVGIRNPFFDRAIGSIVRVIMAQQVQSVKPNLASCFARPCRSRPSVYTQTLRGGVSIVLVADQTSSSLVLCVITGNTTVLCLVLLLLDSALTSTVFLALIALLLLTVLIAALRSSIAN